jgi:hypothetical protein
VDSGTGVNEREKKCIMRKDQEANARGWAARNRETIIRNLLLSSSKDEEEREDRCQNGRKTSA